MTPSPRKIYRPGLLFTILTVVLVLGGCATLPPPEEGLDRAQRALDSARDVRAHQLSEEEFRRAERQLQAAREAAQARDRSRALELAELAEVNADLSRARARARAWQEEVDSKTAENAALRESLEMEGRR